MPEDKAYINHPGNRNVDEHHEPAPRRAASRRNTTLHSSNISIYLPLEALNMSSTGVRTSGAGSRDSHRQATPVIPATPAPGSMRAILLKNCTTRLFVHPLEWTADHIEALDVDLVTSAGKEEERITDETKRQVDERIHLLEAILDLEHTWASSRDAQIREIFPYIADAANITQQDISESILYFEYDKFSVARLPPVILACYQSTTNPIWAYTDRMWTSAARRKRYYAR
ncbi:hypothetical protein WAI453_005571 [Rhynchosporium graminicola]